MSPFHQPQYNRRWLHRVILKSSLRSLRKAIEIAAHKNPLKPTQISSRVYTPGFKAVNNSKMWFNIIALPYISPLSVSAAGLSSVCPKASSSINPLYPPVLCGNVNQQQQWPQEERVASIKCVLEQDSHGWCRKECLGVKSPPSVQSCRQRLFYSNGRHLIKCSEVTSVAQHSPELLHHTPVRKTNEYPVQQTA